MKISQIILCSLCFYFLAFQFLHAAPPAGDVIGWGDDIAGQATGVPSYPFVNGKVVMTDTPFATGAVVSASHIVSNVVAVSAGSYHSLLLGSDGTVIGLGDNFFGEAVGFTNELPYRANGKVRIGGAVLSNVVSIATGRTFSLALKRDGTVVAWGQQARIEDIPKLEPEDYTGLKGNMPQIDPKTGLLVQPQKAEEKHVIRVGTLSDGTVATRLDDQDPVPLSNVVAIVAAPYTEWVLKSDGTVEGWSGLPSSPDGGRLVSVANLSNVVAIAAGRGDYNTPVALKRDGTLAVFGRETTDKGTAPPAGLSNVVAVAAGSSYTLALTRDGMVTGWGYDRLGQATGVPTMNAPNISPARQVRIDGQTLSNIVAITAGQGFSMAVKNDGTVIAWGRLANGAYPATIPAGLSNIVAIAEGEDFCLAVTTNRAVAEKFRH